MSTPWPSPSRRRPACGSDAADAARACTRATNATRAANHTRGRRRLCCAAVRFAPCTACHATPLTAPSQRCIRFAAAAGDHLGGRPRHFDERDGEEDGGGGHEGRHDGSADEASTALRRHPARQPNGLPARAAAAGAAAANARGGGLTRFLHAHRRTRCTVCGDAPHWRPCVLRAGAAVPPHAAT